MFMENHSVYVACLRTSLQGTLNGFTEQRHLCWVWKDEKEFT